MSLHAKLNTHPNVVRDESVSNPLLYAAMKMALTSVSVTHLKEVLVGTYDLDPRTGRQVLTIEERGETYHADCPFCGDGRGRLAVNHMYGVKDKRTGFFNTELWKCYNLECQSDPENRRELREMLFDKMDGCTSHFNYNTSNLSMSQSSGSKELTHYPFPGTDVSLADLPADHPAIVYLRDERNFDVAELVARWKITYATDATPRTKEYSSRHRIIIPVFVAGMMVGWQARYVGDIPWKAMGVAKYLTCFSKSRAVYGIDEAGSAPYVVIVEGPTDVWRYGPGAVSLLGKAASPAQVDILARRTSGPMAARPLVMVPDRNDPQSAECFKETAHAIVKRQKALSFVPSPVSVVELPLGSDPGKTDRTHLHHLVAAAVATPVRVDDPGAEESDACSIAPH